MKTILLLLMLFLTIEIYPQNLLNKHQISIQNEIEAQCINLGVDSLKIDIIKSICFRESSFNNWAYNLIDGSAGLFGHVTNGIGVKRKMKILNTIIWF